MGVLCRKVILFLSLMSFASILAAEGEVQENYFSPSRETVKDIEDVREERGKEFARLSKGITHYEIGGPIDGEKVVLVHGSTLAMWSWDLQFTLLTNAGYRVLRYDQYGRGLSDIVRGEYNRALYGDQLERLLDEVGFTGEVNFVCRSFGGIVVSKFAMENPNRVKRAMFVSPGVIGMPKIALRVVRGDKGPKFIAKNLASFYAEIEEYFTAKKIPHDPYLNYFNLQASRVGVQATAISMIRSDATTDGEKEYGSMTNKSYPVLIVRGKDDEQISHRHFRAFLRYIPRAVGLRIEDVGHLPGFEKTECLNGILLSFLKDEIDYSACGGVKVYD